MNTAASSDPRTEEVRVTDDEIIAHLADGRVISVPLAWSWRLSEATPAQRARFRLIGTGQGVHWPDVDEDLSVEVCSTEPRHAARTSDPQRPRPARFARTKRLTSASSPRAREVRAADAHGVRREGSR